MNTGLDRLRRLRRMRGEKLTFEDLAIVNQIRPSRDGVGNVAEATALDIADTLKVGDTLAACILARSGLGVVKYGTVLQTKNGRSHMVDALQELLDAAQYLTGEITEARAESRGSLEVASARDHVYSALDILTYLLEDALDDVNTEAINEG